VEVDTVGWAVYCIIRTHTSALTGTLPERSTVMSTTQTTSGPKRLSRDRQRAMSIDQFRTQYGWASYSRITGRTVAVDALDKAAYEIVHTRTSALTRDFSQTE
jgi:hypothetical protein